ncbi:Holliday junction branch migration protein RuvA [Acidipila sp. EB88]|uniref:Holliday junction branch migration protein RuvA n=1 Tax=Acidipila sp. EB88 TaxID=2305226 RepID=UPI000F5D55C0|nr:Holliday junction branch migration protein RuvA [Acidipila sp. EB88]RRA48206.1 Holliday junction branch migration protein RuvA [Acidipila sp. EB88]
MIAHLRGTLFSKTPGSCIVECAGVGYDVAISIPTYSSLPDAPHGGAAAVSLYIHTQVREDALSLFGFLDLLEKRLFERLITVSGVGPRLALTILSGLSVSATIDAIRAQDHASLCRIPGVGKRLAERLAVELKEKLDDLATPAPSGNATTPAPTTPAAEDVLSALLNLGYNRPAAQKALDNALTRDPSVGEHFDTLFRAVLLLIR